MNEKEIFLCTFCPELCENVCPIIKGTGNQAFSPSKKMSTLWFLLNNFNEFHNDSGIKQIFDMCTGCLACTEVCEHDVFVSNNLFEARRLFNKKSVSFLTSEREKFLKNYIPKKFFSKEVMAIYFPGTETLKYHPVLMKEIFALFEFLNIEFIGVNDNSVLDDGQFLYASGNFSQFKNVIEETSAILNRYKLVITSSPITYYLLTSIYPAFGFHVYTKVRFIGEFLYDYVSRAKVKNLNKNLFFFESCVLSRGAKLEHSTLSLVKNVVADRINLFFRHGKNTLCCGMGHDLFETDPKTALSIAKISVDEFLAEGGEILITECPASLFLFKKVKKELYVVHFIEFLSKLLKGGSF